MIKSMTGFGKGRGYISPWGRVSVEIRSVNHRFLDIVLHLPEGLLLFEQRLREEIGKRIKRGHIICRLEINALQLKKPVLNKYLIKEYHLSLKRISRQLNLKDKDIDINTLIGLPGVLSMQPQSSLSLSWRRLKPLVNKALDRLVQRRELEGRALYRDLGIRMQRLGQMLTMVKSRFKKVTQRRLGLYNTEEEKSSFLKSSDINEEIVRLAFHLKNFTRCFRNKKTVIGKELDFILQEMQRETNTIGAKSIDILISSKVIGMKSEIEKMREQVQNVE